MKIVILDGYTSNPGDLSWQGLEALGDVTVHDRTAPEQTRQRCEGADVVLTNKTVLGKDILDQLSSLTYIGILATGYNVVDIQAASENGIVVTNAPGYSTTSVAQMTMALLLELCLRIQRHSDSVKEGGWAGADDFCYWNYPLVELSGKTLGIIGFGSIGEKVADIATAYGMNILGSKRNPTDQSRRKNFQWTGVPDLLKASDVVSLHCPLTPETSELINRESLQTMKRSAFLLNTARGPIIVEEDLADALNNDVIAGAGLDVLSEEPPSADNPLYGAKNCIITPHIAWATKESRGRLIDIVVHNLAAFLDGKPVHVVNRVTV
ncbi:MAG: D-2-hydroxyacid dehydrogenase [Balneolaceae bacterium]